MKIALVFLAIATFVVCISLPETTLTPTTIVSTNEVQPCKSYQYYDSAENGIWFTSVECKNIVLEIGDELSLNIEPRNIDHIVFKNSILPALLKGTFTSFAKLTELYLNRNGMQIIIPGVFNGLSKLEVLHLENNNIMNISQGSFSSLTNLNSLDMSRNSITSLEEGCFAELKNLKFLNLNRNNLFILHPDIFVNLTALEILDLSFNYLFMSEYNFTLNLNSPYLEKLLIRNNYLKHCSISADVQNLLNFELLDLSFNNLTVIDFYAIGAPKYANFSNNNINAFKEWSDLNQSTELTENNINITGAMKILYLGQNDLENPEGLIFANSGEIIHLDLSFNSLKEILNNSFQGLNNLEVLLLNNNQIFSLSKGCFVHLKSLKMLSLSHNSLKYLGDEIFTGLPALTNLYLDNNKLSVIKEKTFYGLNNLENLHLNENSLSTKTILTVLKYVPNLNVIYFKIIDWGCDGLLNITEALNNKIKLANENDVQVFKITCDSLTIKVILNTIRVKYELCMILLKICFQFLFFMTIFFDIYIISWYFLRFKFVQAQINAKIKKIKKILSKLETVSAATY